MDNLYLNVVTYGSLGAVAASVFGLVSSTVAFGVLGLLAASVVVLVMLGLLKIRG